MNEKVKKYYYRPNSHNCLDHLPIVNSATLGVSFELLALNY